MRFPKGEWRTDQNPTPEQVDALKAALRDEKERAFAYRHGFLYVARVHWRWVPR